MKSTLLLLLLLLQSPAQLTAAFPIHFPPSNFTDSTLINRNQIALLTKPDVAIAWADADSPPILLCSAPDFYGEYQLLERNMPKTCLNLNNVHGDWSVGLEVGSLKIGGGAGCSLYSRPACTGATIAFLAKDTIPDLSILQQFDHTSVMSLFCEPLREFTPWDGGASVRTSSSSSASSSAARSARGSTVSRRARKRAENPPEPSTVGIEGRECSVSASLERYECLQ
ncbi:hypothetical protein Q7P37_009483 [Cladosporium fusiforme]